MKEKRNISDCPKIFSKEIFIPVARVVLWKKFDSSSDCWRRRLRQIKFICDAEKSWRFKLRRFVLENTTYS